MPNLFMSANQNGQTFYNAFQKNRTKVKDGENLISKSLSELGEIDRERICFVLLLTRFYILITQEDLRGFLVHLLLCSELTTSTGDTIHSFNLFLILVLFLVRLGLDKIIV